MVGYDILYFFLSSAKYEDISVLTGTAPQPPYVLFFLHKFLSVLGNQSMFMCFSYLPDKDGAAYSTAWEAPPSVHLLPC